MKLKKIVETCAEVLGLQDVVELINKPETTAEDLKKNSSFSILQRCANLVLGNIAGNYVQCVARQTFVVSVNRINLDRFENDFIKVINVKKEGLEIDYDLFADHLRLQNGTVEIEYAYMPRFENADSQLVINGVSEDCLVYGILAEYAFISGMFNEAKIWNEKFERFLFGTDKKNTVLPAPRW